MRKIEKILSRGPINSPLEFLGLRESEWVKNLMKIWLSSLLFFFGKG
jgi:hypothetical protein